MVNETSFYKELKGNLKTCEKILSRVPRTENITDTDHLKVQSYILLCHAAFEEYIEKSVVKLLDEAFDAFTKSKNMTPCIASLLIFETIHQFKDETSRKKIKGEVVDNLIGFAAIAKRNHLQEVSENHGIKLKDQKRLMLGIGLDPDDIDAVTAASLDAFGTKRGSVAHSAKVQIEDTRSSIVAMVRSLMIGLRSFDMAFVRAAAALQ